MFAGFRFDIIRPQVADAVGKSRTTVTNLLRLLDLQDEVKCYPAKREIEMGHASDLLGLAGPNQVQAAQKVVVRGFNVRAPEKLARELPIACPAESESSSRDPDIEALETWISEKLGAWVTIQHKAGGGRQASDQLHDTGGELEGALERIT